MDVLSISELNSLINNTLRQEPYLRNIWISGELSNFKNHVSSGHWYFSLKDKTAAIKCVMFRSQTVQVSFKPENGMKVMVLGSIRLYEKDGNIQIYIEEMYPSGLGALYLAFEQLKKTLSAEGLFMEERKKTIPKYPSRIGIITSPTGAALRDIINIARRRNPCIALLLIPSSVQGKGASLEIVKAIENANRFGQLDLLIVSRGGGSLEELWAFNTEEVARAIAHSNIPVISAVGHEVDYTIADFAADLRAPTPSAAAELAIPVLQDIQQGLKYSEEKLANSLQNIIAKKRRQIDQLSSEPALARPFWKIEQERQNLDSLTEQLREGMTRFVTKKSDILKLLSAKLDLLSPLTVLSRGYSLVYDSEGKLIKSIQQTREEEQIKVRLIDGSFYGKITGKE